MEKAPADYIHSSGDTPPPRLSARSLHAVCTLSAQICTNLHEIYTNLHLSELDKAGSPPTENKNTTCPPPKPPKTPETAAATPPPPPPADKAMAVDKFTEDARHVRHNW
jgi:hypothetical protein